MWWLVACAPPEDADPVDTGPDLPGHSECLAEGEEMPLDTCEAVVEEDGRLPTVSFRASNAPPIPGDDPRLTDPDYVWLTAETKRCACVCCHSTVVGGPGTFQWDIDFAPVWIDSANDWVLSVFVGDTGDELRTLPTSDPDRLHAVIEREWARRDAAR
jgi:hypothetical protein